MTGEHPSRSGASRAGQSDAGFLTLWMVGLCILLLGLGGVSLDLWRVFSQRQALVGLTDAAAVAGASGIDQGAARTGVIRLDPALATNMAEASIAGQPDRGSLVNSSLSIVVSPDGSEITVSAEGRTSLTLLSLLSGQGAITFHVISSAAVRRSP